MVKYIHLGLILLLVACGSITIDVTTDVVDDDDITHTFSIVMSGEIVNLVGQGDENLEELDNEFFQENCDILREVERFEISCLNISQEKLASLEGGNDGSLGIEVTKTDLGDAWEYRATMENIFYDVEDDMEDSPVDIDMDMILKARHHWTVTMPGEVVEANSDSNVEGVVKFTGKPGDGREIFTVVSRKEKPTGLFGSCN